jgi:hypothetical protein
MSLVNRKSFVGLVSALCILSVAVACTPRKKDWKARTKPAGQSGPGGVGPKSLGGLAKVAGPEKQECISFSAQKDQPLYLDSAVDNYLADAYAANGDEAYSQNITNITKSGGWTISNENTKSVKLVGMGTSFDFDNSVLDSSGCYEIAIYEAKFSGTAPTFLEGDLVAIRFLNETPGNQVFQISNVSDESIKRSVFNQVKAGGQRQKSEIKFEDIKRINAIVIQTESYANAKVEVVAPTDSDKTKAQDLVENGLSGRSVSVISKQVVYPSSGATAREINGNVENVIIFKGGDPDKDVLLISNQDYNAAVSNEVTGEGSFGPVSDDVIVMAQSKNGLAKYEETSSDYSVEYASKLDSESSSFKIQVQLVPSQNAKAISSEEISFIGEDGQVIRTETSETKTVTEDGPNF